MRSVLTALAVCLILMGGAIAPAPRPAAAASNPGQVLNAVYLGLGPRMPVPAGHRGAPDGRPAERIGRPGPSGPVVRRVHTAPRAGPATRGVPTVSRTAARLAVPGGRRAAVEGGARPGVGRSARSGPHSRPESSGIASEHVYPPF